MSNRPANVLSSQSSGDSANSSNSQITVSWDQSALGWGLLGRGSRVGIISPSGPFDPVALRHGLLRLRSWGLEPVVGSHCSSAAASSIVNEISGFPAITAGPDEARAADLEWALTDPSLDAVLVARGGYGMVRTIGLVDWALVRAARARPVVGMSDITALHEALRVHTTRGSLLGPHVTGLLAKGVEPGSSVDGPTHDSFVSVLCGEVLGAKLAPSSNTTPYWGSARVARSGSVVAPWFGGNLAVLASLSGSAEGLAPDRPFVAVLEDVNEAPYRIDRMLTQLLRAGWFANAVGVVCGSWVGCGAPGEVEAVVLERLASIGGPIVFDAPFGHGDRHVTLPLGVPVSLDARGDDSANGQPRGSATSPSGIVGVRTENVVAQESDVLPVANEMATAQDKSAVKSCDSATGLSALNSGNPEKVLDTAKVGDASGVGNAAKVVGAP
jgi:muramoyltetrapeptide carboxypeptidase